MSAFLLVAVIAFTFLGFSAAKPIATEESVIAGKNGGHYNILLLGHDNTSNLTDVVMIAAFDLTSESLSILQIPRDTYFAYTNADYKKINGATHALGGAANFAKALSEALAVKIDSYVEFDLGFVREAVDFVGGVTIDIPCNMDYDDPAQNLHIHLKKGEQTLGGQDAVGFIRFRSGYLRADLGRVDAQKLFLAAFSHAFYRNVSAADIPAAALLAIKHIKTDMRLDTMISLAVAMRSMKNEAISVLTFPGEEVRSEYSGAWYYILSREGCLTAVDRYLAGEGSVGEAAFDTQRKFTDTARKNFREIYERKIDAVPYTFDKLDKEGIGIQ